MQTYILKSISIISLFSLFAFAGDTVKEGEFKVQSGIRNPKCLKLHSSLKRSPLIRSSSLLHPSDTIRKSSKPQTAPMPNFRVAAYIATDKRHTKSSSKEKVKSLFSIPMKHCRYSVISFLTLYVTLFYFLEGL